MTVVRVTWNDAIADWPKTWVEVAEIAEHLEDTSVVTIGHLVEGHNRPFVVVAASKSANEFGGIFAIPEAMVTLIEKWDDSSVTPTVPPPLAL